MRIREQNATHRSKVDAVEGHCNIISSRVYQDLKVGVAGILAASLPLHLKTIHKSVEWLLQHEHQVAHWGHLPVITADEDGGYNQYPRQKSADHERKLA